MTSVDYISAVLKQSNLAACVDMCHGIEAMLYLLDSTEGTSSKSTGYYEAQEILYIVGAAFKKELPGILHARSCSQVEVSAPVSALSLNFG